MSWLFSQALVVEYLVDTSSDGEPSALLNGNHTQQAYCAPDKMTAFSRLSRFGMTYKPLPETRGEELLTLYRAGFLAKTLAQLEKEQELTERAAGCGEKWRASFTKYSPDSRSWKTHQCSLLGDLAPFSETWPQWGLMRDGECWEQQTLAHHIRGTEFGLLPNGLDSFHTPNTLGLNGGSNSRKALKKRLMFLTPVKSEGNGSAAFKLTHAVEASMGRIMPKMQKNPHKWEQFQSWASLNARDWKDSGASQRNRKSPNLGTQVHWTTPVSDDTSHRTKKYAQGGTPLSMQAGGQLNPTWVEWLMGWPLGWTDLKPLAMDKSHSVPPPLGIC